MTMTNEYQYDKSINDGATKMNEHKKADDNIRAMQALDSARFHVNKHACGGVAPLLVPG